MDPCLLGKAFLLKPFRMRFALLWLQAAGRFLFVKHFCNNVLGVIPYFVAVYLLSLSQEPKFVLVCIQFHLGHVNVRKIHRKVKWDGSLRLNCFIAKFSLRHICAMD